MQTKKKEVMSSEISIKLNVAGMVTGVDVENNDFLDEEQVVEGLATGAGLLVGSLFDELDKENYNYFIDYFMETFLQSVNTPSNAKSKLEFDALEEAMENNNPENYVTDDSQIDYYQIRADYTEAVERAKEKNDKADNIRHFFGNKN